MQFWAPDDGPKNRQKHVDNLTEINNLGNVTSCWLYLAKWFKDCSVRCVSLSGFFIFSSFSLQQIRCNECKTFLQGGLWKENVVVHSCWSVMRNLYSFHVYVNLEVFVSDKFSPHIPAAALSLLHVTRCMLWCACVYWHVRFSARIRSLFAWTLSYTTVSGNPWLLSSMSTTTGLCVNYHAF